MRIPLFSVTKHELISLLVLLLMIISSPLDLWAQDELDSTKHKEIQTPIPKQELVNKKLKFKTRKYITSGGLQYIPNTKNGSHSPFMKELLEALRSYGGRDSVLTLSEIYGYLSNMRTEPHVGAFGYDEFGSDVALSQGGYDGGKIYALIIGNSTYEEWNDLKNPVIDADAIAEELKNEYKAAVEVINNVSKNEFILKIREYATKYFAEKDQLIVIYAGHGEYDDLFNEGYLILRDSKKDDPGKVSQLSHSTIRTIIESIPSRHTLLIMDASFGRVGDALN